MVDESQLDETKKRPSQFRRYARDIQAFDPHFRKPFSNNRNDGGNSTTAKSDLRRSAFWTRGDISRAGARVYEISATINKGPQTTRKL
jgi:hypothetical protein